MSKTMSQPPRNTMIAQATARCRQRQAGFTLIEMMISVTIGLGILAGLVGVLAANSGNSRSNDRTSELMTNGRYALNSIKQELREAGFRAYTLPPPTPTDGTYAAPTVGCVGAEAGATVGTFIANIRQGVWGADDVNPFAANCITDYAAGNDVLVVRRVAVSPATALVANTVYFHSTYDRGQVFRGTVAPTFTGGPQPLASFPLQVYVYYVRPFTVVATESPLVPALMRVVLRADGTMSSEMVASGIERMQLQYGHLNTAPATQYLDAGAGDLTATSSDSAFSGWEDVNSVRIWLLARNSTPEPGYVNTQTYPMGDQNVVVNDNYRRQLFTTVAQLRN